MLTEIDLVGLNDKERKMANDLLKHYKECRLDAMKCPNDTTKQFYYGKASGINDISILFFNIDLSDI